MTIERDLARTRLAWHQAQIATLPAQIAAAQTLHERAGLEHQLRDCQEQERRIVAWLAALEDSEP